MVDVTFCINGREMSANVPTNKTLAVSFRGTGSARGPGQRDDISEAVLQQPAPVHFRRRIAATIQPMAQHHRSVLRLHCDRGGARVPGAVSWRGTHGPGRSVDWNLRACG
jgi:hypothetical protein